MLNLSRFVGLALVLSLGLAWAQETPPPSAPGDVPEKTDAKNPKDAAAGAEQPEKEPIVIGEEKDDNVKTLAPKDVPHELQRLKSKADIKAEITVQPLHGKASVFKGVIRNGKLIERFVGRRFVPQEGIDQPRCGVRLWWVNGTDGWIFFRYSAIKSVALTGVLTAEERREIIRKLKAKKNGEGESADERDRKQAEELEAQLEKMSDDELESFLFRNYPEDEGWSHNRLRALKRKQIIENQPLTREEAIFVRYFNVLIKARLKELKRLTKKIEVEPGSEDEDGDDAPDAPEGQPPIPVPGG